MKIIPIPTPCSGKKSFCPRLPVAVRANNRIRFATTQASKPAMLPLEALAWLDDVLGQGNPAVEVEIAGPGDPLAALEPTLETLGLLRKNHPRMKVSLTTLGIGGEEYAKILAGFGVTQVTLLVDAVDAGVAEKLYAWIRPANKTVPLAKGVAILFAEQAKAVPALLKAGIEVRVQTTVYPGYNEAEVEKIASFMAGLGVKTMAITPFTPTAGEETLLPEPDSALMTKLRNRAAHHLDIAAPYDEAAKLCGNDVVAIAPRLPSPAKQRPNVAVVSSNGMDIDLHLGQASKILIYGPRSEDGLPCLLDTRQMPPPGSGSGRWETLAAMLNDCFALLAASAGDSPKKILLSHGISVLISEDGIAGTVDVLYGGGKKGKKCRK